MESLFQLHLEDLYGSQSLPESPQIILAQQGGQNQNPVQQLTICSVCLNSASAQRGDWHKEMRSWTHSLRVYQRFFLSWLCTKTACKVNNFLWLHSKAERLKKSHGPLKMWKAVSEQADSSSDLKAYAVLTVLL